MKDYKITYKFIYRKVHVNQYMYIVANDKQQAYTFADRILKDSFLDYYRIKRIV